MMEGGIGGQYEKTDCHSLTKYWQWNSTSFTAPQGERGAINLQSFRTTQNERATTSNTKKCASKLALFLEEALATADVCSQSDELREGSHMVSEDYHSNHTPSSASRRSPSHGRGDNHPSDEEDWMERLEGQDEKGYDSVLVPFSDCPKRLPKTVTAAVPADFCEEFDNNSTNQKLRPSDSFPPCWGRRRASMRNGIDLQDRTTNRRLDVSVAIVIDSFQH